jgi:PhnB protein
MTAHAAQLGVSPELFVRRGREAVEFYKAAFGAEEIYRVGGTAQHAVRLGATEVARVGKEHGWLLGRIDDPFGHRWEIGKPLGDWPPPARSESGGH